MSVFSSAVFFFFCLQNLHLLKTNQCLLEKYINKNFSLWEHKNNLKQVLNSSKKVIFINYAVQMSADFKMPYFYQ